MSKTAEELQAVIDANSNMPVHLRDDLSYRHMLLLAECFEDWADTENGIGEERAAQLIGHARGMRNLAWLVGEDWSPPEPERLCMLVFLARELEKRGD